MVQPAWKLTAWLHSFLFYNPGIFIIRVYSKTLTKRETRWEMRNVNVSNIFEMYHTCVQTCSFVYIFKIFARVNICVVTHTYISLWFTNVQVNGERFYLGGISSAFLCVYRWENVNIVEMMVWQLYISHPCGHMNFHFPFKTPYMSVYDLNCTILIPKIRYSFLFEFIYIKIMYNY